MHKIQIKETNDPKIIKFESNNFLVKNNSYEFDNIDEAKNSPLAQQLFHLPFVKKVYIANNFIAIERYDIVTWEDVVNEVAVQIENYLNNNLDVITATQLTKKPVTIYAESTPNPNVLKFVSNKKLITESYEFTSIDECKNAPIAFELFRFPFVKSVFIDYNYISITKYDIAEWDDITSELREFIKSYIEDGKEIISDSINQKADTLSNQIEDLEKLDDTSKEIVSILNEYVRPAVASDGGNIEFKSYNPETKVVKVVLQGACSGCPSSTYTLKNGIENMLKQMLQDKVSYVEAING